MTLIFFTRYGRLGPSSRIRTFQLLENSKLKTSFIQTLMNDESLKYRYDNKKYPLGSVIISIFKRFLFIIKSPKDSIFYIEKELFPWLPFSIERFFIGHRKYILDFDDATWHYYDQHKNALVKYFLKSKLKKLISRSNLVFTGNEYLKNYALCSGARNVVKIPTVINFENYTRITPVDNFSRTTRIVWIGTPATSEYLSVIYDPLKRLSKEFDFEFVVIGDKDFKLEGVNVVSYDWSEHTEISIIKTCDIGVMPFFSTKFTEGKCGYKLIQYMACGLSVVATNSGANSEIINKTGGGFVVNNDIEWYDSIRMLILDQDLRFRNKLDLPKKIENYYSVSSVINIWQNNLSQII